MYFNILYDNITVRCYIMTDSELKLLVKQTETLELNDEEKSKAKGSFIDLPSGFTHYEMKGSGEAVVLCHGYATPYYIYDKIFEKLVAEGYKVIRYDLLGRGLSERTDAVYDPAFFAKQLDELTKALLGDEKFYLFGTSMGGSITTAFCKLYPGRVKKLVLLAPAGMDTFIPPFYMKLATIPLIGKLIFAIVAKKSLLTKCASELKYSVDEKDYYMRSFAESSKYKGFIRCTLSSLKNTILNTSETVKGYISVNEQKLPLLVIWGTEDKTMPYYQHKRLLEVCPDVELVTFEGSGHIFLFDEGDRTNEIILPFLKK